MTNTELKTKLFSQIIAIGNEKALFPLADSEIDATIKQLEKSNPTKQPLDNSQKELLIGDWELVYASNGTVVTRPLAEATIVLGSALKLNKIWQTLAISGDRLTTSNQALIELPLIGEIYSSADGTWQPESDLKSAQVSFSAFSLQAKNLFYQPWTLPKLEIPVLEQLQSSALWITSYLDEDTRIGQGATGNLFVFKRIP